MKKIICWLMMLPLLFVTVAVTSTPSEARPIVRVSECRIDFNATVYWTGDTEELWQQIVALHNMLPQKCWGKCNFTNIDLFYWQRIFNRRFVAVSIVGSELMDEMRKCHIEVNTPPSLVSGSSGDGVICTTGNTFTLHVSGNGNSVSANQEGCNTVTITIYGNSAVVHIWQSGKNTATLTLTGDNISLSLHQDGVNSYSGQFTSGQTANIVQIN